MTKWVKAVIRKERWRTHFLAKWPKYIPVVFLLFPHLLSLVTEKVQELESSLSESLIPHLTEVCWNLWP